MSTGRISQMKVISGVGQMQPTSISQSSGDSLEVLSGGSTGNPKRLSRSIQSWIHSAKIEASVFGLDPTDHFAVIGDPNHSLWAYAKFRAELIGSKFLGFRKPDEPSLTQLQSSQSTVLYGVPELVLSVARRLAKSRKTLPSIRRILLGGGSLPNRAPLDLIQRVFPNAETWMFYGSAEASFIGYAALGQPYKAFPEVKLEIRDDKSIWVLSPMTVSPNAWVNTGDVGCWVESGRFEIIGRVSRQLQAKGKKHLTEPMEHRLSTGLDLDRVALLQDRSGHVCCICARSGPAAELPDPTSARVNQLIRECDPDFPLVRRIQTLAFGAWPLTGSGKTNWQALADYLDLAP